MRPHVSETVRTALVTAFTIATALIWKDFIENLLSVLLPESEQLFAEFLSAVAATVIALIGITLALNAENRVERLLNELDELDDILLERLSRRLHRREKPDIDGVRDGAASDSS